MNSWGELILETIQNPANAASKLVAFQPKQEVLWTGFALVQVLGALLFAVQDLMIPGQIEMFEIKFSPIHHLIINTLIVLGFSFAVTVCGRMLGGSGTIFSVLACLTWVSFVQIIVLAANFIVSLIYQDLAAILQLSIALYTIYVSVHFINAAHELGSLWRAFGVVLLAAFSIAFVLVILGQPFLPDTLG